MTCRTLWRMARMSVIPKRLKCLPMLWTRTTIAGLSVLNVRLHDRPIRTITEFGQVRTLFSFADDYINDVERPTLGLRFRDRFGDLITGIRRCRMRLMPFFPKGIYACFLPGMPVYTLSMNFRYFGFWGRICLAP